MRKRTGLQANTLTEEGGQASILEYYRTSGASIFKALQFDRAFFARLKALGVTIIGRVYESNQLLDNDSQERFIGRVVDHARRFPEVDYWEGYNEAFQRADQGISRYAAMEALRVKRLADVGARAAIGCFSTGQPPLPYGVSGNDGGAAWRAFVPALLAALKHEGILALHEYDAPWMSRLIRGDLWSPHAYGWLCLRYRLVARYLTTLGLQMYHPIAAPRGLRIALTETGIDGGVTGRPGPPGGGWADFEEWPDPALGDYPHQRFWYNWQLGQDAYVTGATGFGDASADPTWHSFSLLRRPEVLRQVVDLENRLPATPVPEENIMQEGVDVSRWQGKVGWARARGAGITFAYLKATEGASWKDPRFEENAAGAEAAGIAWGAYHYFRNGVDVEAQVAVFTSQRQGQLPPAIDFEDTKAAIEPDKMQAFCELVESKIGRPVLYTGVWWWRRVEPFQWATRYPLWLADYTGAVEVPTGWQEWTIHQYTNKGQGASVGVHSTYVDRNRFKGSMEELLALRQAPHVPAVQFAKVAWATEQAARILQAEGLQAEHNYVVEHYVADAIRKRDA